MYDGFPRFFSLTLKSARMTTNNIINLAQVQSLNMNFHKKRSVVLLLYFYFFHVFLYAYY